VPAGYSGTLLAKKLGIKAGHRVGLIGAPVGFEEMLDGLPANVRLSRRAAGRFDVIVFFTSRSATLGRRFSGLAARLDRAGGLWVAWPKMSSGVASDLKQDRVRRSGLDAGLVDNKICAIDEVWSGLRFVYRLQDR
jgi:hypothetical protein